MTAGEILALADELRPNAYGAERKLCWLRRLDGQILSELEESHLPPAARSAQSEALSFRTSPQTGVGIRTPETGDADCPVASLLAMTGEESPVLPDVYHADTELLAPFPWGEGLYLSWLFCQIDLHNGEIQKYNQSLSQLAAAWRSLADWFNRSRRPRGVPAWHM